MRIVFAMQFDYNAPGLFDGDTVMHIRCSYCRHSFNMNRDYIAEAVAAAAEKRQRYHGMECPKCRKLIKVPIKQMRRFAPRSKPKEQPPEATE